jgi:hypothetical protein
MYGIRRLGINRYMLLLLSRIRRASGGRSTRSRSTRIRMEGMSLRVIRMVGPRIVVRIRHHLVRLLPPEGTRFRGPNTRPSLVVMISTTAVHFPHGTETKIQPQCGLGPGPLTKTSHAQNEPQSSVVHKFLPLKSFRPRAKTELYFLVPVCNPDIVSTPSSSLPARKI